MSSTPYREQVALLLRVLPIVGCEEVFALKGGTAINQDSNFVTALMTTMTNRPPRLAPSGA
jgi:hypothetical protein